MLRTVSDQPTLWESVIPECLMGLPGDLAEIDELLDDPRFFEPFRPFFDPTHGRPSIPMETYLRMMFLKYRYRLGFEPVCAEVADSLAWRRFCRVPLGTRVPHPTTLMKITKRCGKRAIDGLNEALLAKAHEDKLIRLDRVRADTTVVEANVAYPTDSGLLAKGVAKLAKLAVAIKATGLASRTTFRDRTRSMRRRAHDIGAWLRRRGDDAKAEVNAINAEMVAIACRAVRQGRHVALNARRGLRRNVDAATDKTLALLADLERTAELVERIAAQTRRRIAGDTPDGATRIVSLHDADARPIAKGRLGRPVEFGYKAQVVDNVDGVVLDHGLHIGNPPDAPMLVPAIARIIGRFGRAPRAVTADRGYGEAAVDRDLQGLGVKRVVIPRKGRPGAARQATQRTRSFRKLVKWRTGSEARISWATLGAVLARRGDLAEADRLLEAGVERMRRQIEPLLVIQALLALVPVRRALGFPGDARRLVTEAGTLIEECADPGILCGRFDDARRLVATPLDDGAANLTRRELEILRLLATSLSQREIGRELYVSYNTVHTHLRAIYRKLGATSRREALEIASKHGLVDGLAPESPG